MVVRCSSNWREAAKTLSDLAVNNGLTIHRILYFHEPYVGPEEIPTIVEDTYQQTRSQYCRISYSARILAVAEKTRNALYCLTAAKSLPIIALQCTLCSKKSDAKIE